MGIRPFPLPYNIGVDITATCRFDKYANGSRHVLNRFLEKVFTVAERQSFWHRHEQWKDNKEESLARFLAGRWAAKEAVIKAYSLHRRLMLRDVEILQRQQRGPVAIVLDQRRGRMAASDSAATNSLAGADGMLVPALHARTDGEGPRLSVPDSTDHEDKEEGTTGTDGQVVRISISHDGGMCVAVALAPLGDLNGDVGGEATAREAW